MPRIGFIVNPIAGMGGSVGLKGTDGKDILRKAIEKGAKPIAPLRAEKFLQYLAPHKKLLELIVAPKDMGEYESLKAGFNPTVLPIQLGHEIDAEDTKKAAKLMADEGVELLVFCGGDGTARDVLSAIDQQVPVLGVPAGVKMYSAVFANDPFSAATLVMKFISGEADVKEAEVLDIDEEAFRKDVFSVKLFGYMLTPYEPELVQGVKAASPQTESEKSAQLAIAKYVVEQIMEDNVLYILGPGTTVKAICDYLSQPKTLLGVDLMLNKRVIARDLDEQSLLKYLEEFKEAKVIITPIGNQGFIFGRGNQQISPRVLRKIGKENVIILATPSKLSGIKSLKVDTGDEEIDSMFRGYLKVVIDYGRERIVKCS
ncbi:MAG: ATP-NAD kinase [Candidatus Methanomethylicota archaeon]|uniref:ATP-NAD kinase n=1 Tax=Thermoproteota archaeon TaxID=2056631 RepID=A0A497ESX3_9CREN|nr:MAG: ATP-NAD kinase [Candidatus Verstraetearchaeota archaeon]